jgi:ribosomal protein L24E
MTEDSCSFCGGTVTEIEVAPVRRLEGTRYGRSEGAPFAGTVATICSLCERFQGQNCDECGGRVLWEWHGPGQALWVCEACGDSDIALHRPPRPVTWKCSVCGNAYYTWGEPPERACSTCKKSRGKKSAIER